jgi:hypothetical protein
MIIRQEDGQAPIIKTEIDMNDIDFLYSDLEDIRETLKETKDVKLKAAWEGNEHFTQNEKGKTIPVERTLKEVVNEAFETVEKLKNRLEDEVEILKKLSLYDGDTKGLVKWFINRKANQEGNTSTEMMEKHYNADWDENDTKH